MTALSQFLHPPQVANFLVPPENQQAGLWGSLEGGQACRSAIPRAEP